MLTERLPHNTDSDDYIRAWARRNLSCDQPLTYVSLLSTCSDAPSMACIDWNDNYQTVKRFNSN